MKYPQGQTKVSGPIIWWTRGSATAKPFVEHFESLTLAKRLPVQFSEFSGGAEANFPVWLFWWTSGAHGCISTLRQPNLCR
jgi:hypothetical protein